MKYFLFPMNSLEQGERVVYDYDLILVLDKELL